MQHFVTSKRPYFIRAMHDWITDNKYTPYILIDASVSGVIVPNEYIQDGKITLNISYSALSNLKLETESITFDARFDGKSINVFIPCDAVLNIYAQETGEGMIFSDGIKNHSQKKKSQKAPHLKLVE
ncbi:MAG TPA: ClpXP protease specificity-enhancing factor [Woeseiaceae bacterium]|nr:ClpXP protease specificity-enhancing factor [Woeseiaceae bacterium]|tara:strand:- start:2219 stop:2599 length:381 start_codon:yes stop_codon:yes gene_type:complete